MPFAKIKNEVVVQIQPNKQKGFEEVPIGTIVGQIKTKNGFENPQPVPLTEDEILSQIKIEAARRIQDSGHDWMALRQVTRGEAVPKAVIDYAAAVRAASNTLEDSLPQDFADNKYWPVVI